MPRIKAGPNGGKGYQLREAIAKEGNWLTPQEDDSSNVNPSDNRRETLVSQVNKNLNWPTPEASIMEIWGEKDRVYWTGQLPRRIVQSGHTASLGLARLVQVPGFGHHAPDNPNSGGSRREWLTPKTGDGQPTIHHPERKDGGQPNLAWQMEKQEMTSPQQWATPRSGKTTEENQEMWQARQEKGDVATMPLTLQVKVDWRTPQAQEAGAKVETLFTKDGLPAKPGQRAYRKTPKGEMVLQSQTINQQVEMGVEKSKKSRLSPRWVETLMGLPLGWSSPNCPASVTRNWLRFINGWF
jgi:hypothetical protein